MDLFLVGACTPMWMLGSIKNMTRASPITQAQIQFKIITLSKLSINGGEGMFSLGGSYTKAYANVGGKQAGSFSAWVACPSEATRNEGAVQDVLPGDLTESFTGCIQYLRVRGAP